MSCIRGHDWTPRNTYWYRDAYGKPRRKCKACTLLHQKRRRKPVKKIAARASNQNDADNCIRLNRLMHLQELLERESRAWLRADIQAEIDKLCD